MGKYFETMFLIDVLPTSLHPPMVFYFIIPSNLLIGSFEPVPLTFNVSP